MCSTDSSFVRLDPPQRRKKWVDFQENDIESQLFPDGRRHSASAFTSSPPLNTSNGQTNAKSQLEDNIISSDSALSSPLSSSLGSAGEGGGVCSQNVPSNKVKFDYETVDKQRQLPLAHDASTDSTTSSTFSFNASFGGFSHSGVPVNMKNAFPQPNPALLSSRRRHSQLAAPGLGRERISGDESSLARCRLASVSSTDSQGSSHTTTSIKFSDLNEIEDLEQRYAELLVGSADTHVNTQDGHREGVDTSPGGQDGQLSRYSALKNIRLQEGAYMGWSNSVLGEKHGWSEQIKGDIDERVLKNQQLQIPPGGSVLIESESTPELPSLRQITWPKSPSRTFVRNFP
eukprot:TRINITY_DN5522_c0_g2_i11.p1 TRINITY_DN5522_c0_g2~~TRINITY_DN5522_c0_g2_i11.p1  ORF type:complete len:355 (-),score=64.80 TRINITY_DN5522_c0_g2_i11:646-1680(-)